MLEGVGDDHPEAAFLSVGDLKSAFAKSARLQAEASK